MGLLNGVLTSMWLTDLFTNVRRSGVLRTHLLVLIRGAKESHSLLQKCCEELKPERLFKAFPHVKISFPCDGKFLNYLVGLMAPSAAFGYPYTLWSQITRFSDPDHRHCVEELAASAEIFLALIRLVLPTSRHAVTQLSRSRSDLLCSLHETF